MTNMDLPLPYSGKLAVLYEGVGDIGLFEALAKRLAVPLWQVSEVDKDGPYLFYLCWRDGCLKLLDQELLKKGGLTVEIEPRNGEQRSWPAPKEGALAKALGRKTRTVVDATAGWGQDSLHIFRMGYGAFAGHGRVAFGRVQSLGWVGLGAALAINSTPVNDG